MERQFNKAVFLLFVFLFYGDIMAFTIRDLHQCDRQCRDLYSPLMNQDTLNSHETPYDNSTSYRTEYWGKRNNIAHRSECFCYHDNNDLSTKHQLSETHERHIKQKLGKAAKRKWTKKLSANLHEDDKNKIGQTTYKQAYSPPTPPGDIVCGANGFSYSSQEAACKDGTYALHAGPCGACSNPHDIYVLNITKNTLTTTATKCALKYLEDDGEKKAFDCMKESVGFTDSCNWCWIDNMGCDSVTCKTPCAVVKAKGEPDTDPDGNLNKCLACDENYCGDPFIKCAGANRRRSGIISDIERDGKDVWKGNSSCNFF